MILAFIAAMSGQPVAVPVAPGRALARVADTSRLSLVVADTVSQTDPHPLCSDGNCTSLFLGRFTNAEVLSGPPVPVEFTARVEMGSPYNMSYRLAMIVEHRDGQEPLIRGQAGFGDRSQEACFEWRDTEGLHWQPEGPRIVMRRSTICVTK